MTLPSVPPFRRQAPSTPQLPRTTSAPWGLIALGAIALMFATFAYGQFVTGRHTIWGFVVGPMLIGAFYPFLSRMGRAETTFDLTNIMVTSLALHFTAAYFRLTNAADSSVYHNV